MNFFEFDIRKTGDFTILVGAIVASIAFVMELTLLPLMLGAIQEDFGLNVGELSWVFNAYALAIALAVITGGIIGDMVNKQILFSIGVSLFAVGSILATLSGDLQSLIVSRTIQGVGGGLFSPLIPILLTQSESRRSGKILMIWGGLAGVAATSLPVFGNYILTSLGWRAIFYAFAIVSVLAVILVAFGDDRSEIEIRRGIPGLQKLKSLTRIRFILVYIFLTYGCFTFFLFYFPIQLQSNGTSTQLISLFFVCVWATFSVLSFALKDRIDGPGLQLCLSAAPILLALSFVTGILLSDNFAMQIMSAVLAGAGLASSNSTSTHLLLRMSPPDLRVFASSLDIIFARCGGVITVALLSDIVPNQALLAIITLSILALVCSQGFVSLERK
ncbi:MAG: MFS transporter [Paracoccaceae bacterium]